MENRDFYLASITLPREFMIWIHSHPLLSPLKGVASDLSIEAWSKHDENIQFQFGGLYGCQFRSEGEYQDFRAEFLKALDENGIDHDYEHALYYFISFYEQETTEQSIERNHYNTILSEGRFLIDLIEDSTQYYRNLKKDKDYLLVFDPDTDEPVFVKDALFDAEGELNLDVIDSYARQPGDVIRFNRFLVYNTPVFLKLNYNFSFRLNIPKLDSKLKRITQTELPGSFRLSSFLNVLDKILDNQKTNDTLLFQEFNKPGGFDKMNFEQFRNGYLKNAHSHADVVNTIAVALSDYLEQILNFKNKSATARFIYKYLVLFKALHNKGGKPTPDSYSELERFYRFQGYSFNHIRLRLKGKS